MLVGFSQHEMFQWCIMSSNISRIILSDGSWILFRRRGYFDLSFFFILHWVGQHITTLDISGSHKVERIIISR